MRKPPAGNRDMAAGAEARLRAGDSTDRPAITGLAGRLVACVLLLATTAGAVDPARFEEDIKTLSQHKARVIGTPGFQASVDYVREQVKALPNVESREQSFPMMVPVTERADLTIANADGSKGEPVAIHPFWPASIRVNSTPDDGITGRLVYIKDARYDQIPPKDLLGNIAVVEATAGDAWAQAFYFGARALIVLGSPEVNNSNLRSHDLLIPINLPRFYLPDGELAGRIRQSVQNKDEINATLFAKVDWVERQSTNIYALVRPDHLNAMDKLPASAQLALARTVNLGPPGWQPNSNPAALCLSVPLDSSGLVPGLSTGASQAVQTAAGLALLRDLSKTPLARPVLVMFTGGDPINFAGTREMLMSFSDPPAMWREELNKDTNQGTALLKQIATIERDLKRAREVLADPTRLNVTADRTLLDRVGKITELGAALRQAQLFRIRIKPADQRSPEEKADEKRLSDERIDLSAIGFSVQKKPEEMRKTWLPSRLDAERKKQGAAAGQDMGSPSEEDSLVPSVRGYLQKAITAMESLEKDLKAREALILKRIELYEWLAGRIYRAPDPDKRANNSRLIETLIGIDLSDGGRQIGPMYQGMFYRINGMSHIQDWRQWFERLKKQPLFAELRASLDLDPVTSNRGFNTWLTASMAIGSELAPVWGIPGFSMITVNDLRLERDTPADTLENLRIPVLIPQLGTLQKLIEAAGNDPELKTQPEYKWQRNTIVGQVVSPAAGRPVPDLPRTGFLATYYYAFPKKYALLRNIPYSMGVRRNEISPTDAEGRYRFEGLLKAVMGPGSGDYVQMAVEVFRLDPEKNDGSINGSSDIGKQSSDIKIFADIRQDLDPLRSLVFDCEELALVGLYDPRFLQDLQEVTILDARRNAEPQRYNYFLFRQQMAAFVEPGQASHFLFRYGRAGNRLIMLNTEIEVKGSDLLARPRGFKAEDLAKMSPLALVTSRDFFNLDRERITNYKARGVESRTVSQLHKQSEKQLADANAAFQANDGRGMIRDATGAWANEARVYTAARDMANDVVRAAIFLLLLCIPFAFCMERLLIGSPSIYKQIGGIAGIFTVMAVALASFHPAFQISNAPLIIILAFAIICMSAIVIWVVYGKFDTELKRLSSGRGSAASTSFARASVLMSAVLLGIANMRKRKFRTALTATTVVLITFAVLCFTSASRYVGTTTLPTDAVKQYSGIMLRQRGFRPIPPITVENLKAVLEVKTVPLSDRQQQVLQHLETEPTTVEQLIDRSELDEAAIREDLQFLRLQGLAREIDTRTFARREEVPGRRELVEHWWNINPDGAKDEVLLSAISPDEEATFALAAADRASAAQAAPLKPFSNTVTVGALLGLSPGESRLSAIGEVIGPTFQLLENGRQDVIYIAEDTLERMKVREGGKDRAVRIGDRIRVGGLSLELAGSYKSVDFDARVKALSGAAITPINYAISTLDAAGRKLSGTTAEDVSLDADDTAAEVGNVYDQLSSSQIAIVPASVSRLLPSSSLRSLSFRLADQDEVEAVGEDIAKRVAMAMFVGYDDGVRMMAAANLSSVQGGAAVAIPLAIAGLIIFNTMMGSIAERRREIHVYTSLGLAPMHVGALFVAEALTYGLIGTVFGYVIGQGVGKVLSDAGWLGQITLNYSGSSAMLTMGLILVIVLLSALVPARLASKIAAPSIDRSWRVPLPKDDEIRASLPFTINKTAAEGVVGYLAEFFEAHQEGSIGKFSAGKVDFFTEDEQHRPSRGLKTVVWLTPFDLGVRQHLMLVIHPGQFEDIYEVEVVLQRLSGDDGSWYRMNRSFLTELRKQFLQWRSLSPQRMLDYVLESRRLFAQKTETIVHAAGGEGVRMG